MNETEKTGAEKLFETTNDIRRAISTIKAEKRETNKRYKKATTTLEESLESIYDDYEDKQMLLFSENPPTLHPEVVKLIAPPSLM